MITGIGIHTGVVIAGGLGTSDRLHYTIIGDTVNTTQRLEALTRDLFDCSAILVSHSTYTALEENQTGYERQQPGLPPGQRQAGEDPGLPAHAAQERTPVGGNVVTLTRKLRINRRNQIYWVLIFLMIVTSGLVCLALFLFSPNWVKAQHSLPVALHSPLRADYSADLRGMTMGALQIGLVSEAEKDHSSRDSMPTLVVILKTPVMTITPLATRLLSTPLATMASTIPPKATNPLPTSTRSSSSAGTPTPTSSPTWTPTQTPQTTKVTPTAGSTTIPTKPPQATPSSKPPTSTSQPPTDTAVPPTKTSIPPTNIPPSTHQRAAHPDPPAAATHGPAGAHPILSPAGYPSSSSAHLLSII